MRILMLYNSAPHYRKGIFELIDQEYDCTWAVGHLKDIKDLDMSSFKGEQIELKNINLISHFYWQKGVLKLAFQKDIEKYFILGDSYCLSTWLVSMIARLRGKRVSFWSHGWYGKEKGIKKFISRLFWKLPNKGFIYNNYSRNVMIEAGMPAEKFVTIYNSLDYSRQLEIRDSLRPNDIYKNHFKNDHPILIFIGRLTPVKKLDLLIKAISELKQRGENYNLVFVGDGSQGEKLKSLAKELELENNIWFYGACYDEIKNAELIYNADLCVAPGNIGLTSIHTHMFGTPAATHNDFKWQMPEFEVITENETGFFFIRFDLNSMIDGISKWMKNKKDSREEVRKACYKIIDDIWNPLNQIRIIKENL